jgi:hypothetical protein
VISIGPVGLSFRTVIKQACVKVWLMEEEKKAKVEEEVEKQEI